MKKIYFLSLLFVLTSLGLKAQVDVVFTETPGTVYAKIPTQIYFSITEEMGTPNPTVKINDVPASYVMRNGSYKDFYAFVDYSLNKEQKDKILSDGFFTFEVTLNDGVSKSSAKYYVMESLSWTPRSGSEDGASLNTFLKPLSFNFSASLPQDAYVAVGVSLGEKEVASLKDCDILLDKELLHFSWSETLFDINIVNLNYEQKQQIIEAGKFSVFVQVGEHGLKAEGYVVNITKNDVGILFTETPGTVYAKIPTQIYFSITEEMGTPNPTVKINGVPASYVMRNGSYKDFYAFVDYSLNKEQKDKILSDGFFTFEVILNDGVVKSSAKYYVMESLSWTPRSGSEDGASLNTFLNPLSFNFSAPLPQDAYVAVGISLGEKEVASLKDCDVLLDKELLHFSWSETLFDINIVNLSYEQKLQLIEAGRFSVLVQVGEYGLKAEGYIVNTAKKNVGIVFTESPGTLYAKIPTQIYFSITEEMGAINPAVRINDIPASYVMRNGSYKDYYAFVDYSLNKEQKAKILSDGYFYFKVILNDGITEASAKYYVLESLVCEPKAGSEAGITISSFNHPLSYGFSSTLPIDASVVAGISLGEKELVEVSDCDFLLDKDAAHFSCDGKNVDINIQNLSHEQKNAIVVAGGFTVFIQVGEYKFTFGKYVVSSSEAEHILGYCPQEKLDYSNSFGVEGREVFIGAAICLPASKMMGLKGGVIEKIRIGAMDGLEKVFVWIRPSLSAPAIVLKELGKTEKGWNEVLLDEPYSITGEEIYIGYSGLQPADVEAVLIGGETNPNGCFLSIDNTWEDYSSKKWGALYIQGFVKGLLPAKDLALEHLRLDNSCISVDEVLQYQLDLVNNGSSAITNYSIAYKIDEGKAIERSFDNVIDPGNRLEYKDEVQLDNLAEGHHQMTIWCNSGDKDDPVLNDSLSVVFCVYKNSFSRKLLVEQFTTIKCGQCPKGDKVMEAILDSRDDVILVAHHVGFGTDELTVSESSAFLDYGVPGAPSIMIDRTKVPGADGNNPPFSIGYTNTSTGVAVVNSRLDYCANIPAFVSVNIDYEYIPASRSLELKITGERSSIFESLYPNSNLTVFLTEDDVQAAMPQAGSMDVYEHDYVLRAILTDTYGSPIEWSDDKFEFVKTYAINKEWIPAKMDVVAFVNKPFDKNDPNNGNILNANNVSIDDPTFSGIDKMELSPADFSVVDGRLILNDRVVCDGFSIFTVDGKEVLNKNLGKGLYIIRYVISGYEKTMKFYVY